MCFVLPIPFFYFFCSFCVSCRLLFISRFKIITLTHSVERITLKATKGETKQNISIRFFFVCNQFMWIFFKIAFCLINNIQNVCVYFNVNSTTIEYIFVFRECLADFYSHVFLHFLSSDHYSFDKNLF